MASEMVRVFIPDAVVAEWRRRGVFPDIGESTKVPNSRYAPVRCGEYAVSLKAAYRMYDDILDCRANRTADMGRSLFKEYGRAQDTVGSAIGVSGMDPDAWAPGYPVMSLRWKYAGREVRAELYMLGIKIDQAAA